MRIAAVIVAAGSGQRAGGEKPKQYQLIGGKPVVRWSLEAFLAHPQITYIQTVIGVGQEEEFAAAVEGLNLASPVTGGPTRQTSCRLGIEACSAHEPECILIHDAARPFVSQQLITSVIAKLTSCNAVVPALPVTDTIKTVNGSVIGQTVDRSTLVTVQTPQGFHYGSIRKAHAIAAKEDLSLTDDAAVTENAGMEVEFVSGELANVKLTAPEDIITADRNLRQVLYKERPDVRVGQGIDFHVFEAGSSIWLCGVEIAHSHKLKGHSDADVALHAITDAILGSIGEGDIGTHFPPTDPQWKNARSSIFVAKAKSFLDGKGGVIANLDVTILAEAPRIGPHLARMKQSLSEMLGINIDRIAIKATTTEAMGAIGRKEGMAAQAVVTVRLPL